jgi:hypothetical protein
MKVVILTILKDSSSYGHGRTIKNYMDMIKSIDYPRELLSIEILVSDEQEMENIKSYTRNAKNIREALPPFRSILPETRIHFMKDDLSIPRDKRHDDDIQNSRRSALARIRNRLIDFANLQGSYGVLWIDSDLTYIPSHLLKTILKSNKDIVMPFCGLGKDKHRDYDLNAYKFLNGKRKQLKDFYNENPRELFVEIDSVGGTFLFIKTKIHEEGLRFSETPVKNKMGIKALETEGICIEANKLGYKCWFINGEKNAVLHFQESDEANFLFSAHEGYYLCIVVAVLIFFYFLRLHWKS